MASASASSMVSRCAGPVVGSCNCAGSVMGCGAGGCGCCPRLSCSVVSDSAGSADVGGGVGCWPGTGADCDAVGGAPGTGADCCCVVCVCATRETLTSPTAITSRSSRGPQQLPVLGLLGWTSRDPQQVPVLESLGWRI